VQIALCALPSYSTKTFASIPRSRDTAGALRRPGLSSGERGARAWANSGRE
jgi:hypothetical protein